MTGILVFGDNHLIVRGPSPDPGTAHELVRHWSLIRIGSCMPPRLKDWSICTREFRENLRWAVVVEPSVNPAVIQLLDELNARGVQPQIA